MGGGDADQATCGARWPRRRPSGERDQVLAVGIPLDKSGEHAAQSTMIDTLAAAFRHVPVAMAIWTPDGRLIDANPAFSRLFGYEHDEFLRRGATAIAYPDEPWFDVVQWPRMATGESDAYQREKRYLRKDGSVMWGLSTIVGLRDEQAAVVGCLMQVQDITAQKTAEETAQTYEAQLTGLVEQLPVALFTLPPGGSATFQYVSPQFERQTGLGQVDLPSTLQELLELVHPDDRDAVQAMDAQAELTGGPEQIEYRLRGKHDAWVWVDHRSVLMRDRQGRPLAWCGAILDVSERKRLEASLHTSQERFRRAFEDAAIGMSLGTPDDICLDANAAYCRIVGRPREDVIGRRFAELTHPDDAKTYARVHSRLYTGEVAAYEMEKRYLRPDGTVVTGLLTVTAVRDHEGNHLYDIGQLQDITAQKVAEAALRENESRLRQLLDRLPAAIYRRDVSGEAASTYVSPSFSTLLELDPDDLPIGFAAFFDRMHPDDQPAAREAAAQAELTREPMDIEYRLRRSDGEWTWIHDRSVLERNSDGNARAWTGVLLDISDRKRLEASLRESEAHLRTIVEHLPAAIYRLESGANSRYTFMSPSFTTLTGLPADPDQVSPEMVFERVYPDDVEGLRAADAEAQRTGKPLEWEYRICGQDDSWIWVYDRSTLVHEERTNSAAWHGIMLDISEQKRLQALLAESEERFRGTFEGAGIGMSLTDPNGRIFDVNPAFCQLLGYTRDELLGKTFRELSHPDDHDLSLASLSHHVRGEAHDYVFDKRYIRKDGRVVWARLTTNALRRPYGRLRYVITQVEDITARREAEAALHASEARFRSIFEGAGIGMTLASPDRTILLANPAVERLLGYAPDELTGVAIDAISFPVDPEEELELRRRMRRAEIERFQIERRYRRKDGELVSALVDVAAIRDEQGALTATIGQIQDITARKAAEAALLESEARFRSIFEGTGIGIALVSVEGNIVIANPALSQMLGYLPHELAGINIDEITHPDDLALQLKSRAKLVAGETNAYQMEKRYLRRDGGLVWALLNVSAVRDEHGVLTAMIGQVQDITAHKEAEAALHESEALFRSLFEGAGIGMSLSGSDGRIRVANPTFEQMLGYGPGELSGVHVNAITCLDDLAQSTEYVRRAVAGEIDAYQMEKRYLRKDGGVVWGQLHASVVRDERGAMLAIIGQVQDITARREAEAALRESETRFRALVQYDPDLIIVLDEAMRVSYLSPSAEAALGVPVGELLGADERNLPFLHPEDRERVIASLSDVSSCPGAVVSTEARLGDSERDWRWYHITVSNQRADPSLAGYLVNLRDITELKRAEQAIKAALAAQEEANAELERLNQTKSRFLTTISHEFRTPLTAIIGFSELLASASADPRTISEDTAVIHREASRLSRMVDEVLFVDRVDAGYLSLSLKPLDLNTVAQEVTASFRRLAHRHQFQLDLDPELLRVDGDHDRLAQALTNLISNAVKYSPNGGTVTIETHNHGDEVVLSVRDKGIGIARRDTARIFDRFERVETGFAGRIGGTGLGLAIVREIVQVHHGRVWVESTPRVGSTFSLALPARRRRKSEVGGRE
jgi:PAS domain S-box-containing protein